MHARAICLLLLSTVLFGCEDHPQPMGPREYPAASDLNPEGLTSSGNGSHQKGINRFKVEISITGTLRPHHPLTLGATARALLPTQNARLTLSLPEVHLAEAAGWDPYAYHTPMGVSIPPQAQKEGALPKGAARSLQHRFSVQAPGYYRVVASAVPASPEPEVIGGAFVQNVVHREVWLWITEQGGRITEEFEPTLFGDSLLAQPGPFRRSGRSGPSQGGPAPSGALAAGRSISASSTGTATAPVALYWNQDADPPRYDPLPNAKVVIIYTYMDASGTFVDDVTVQYTDASGRFYLDCGIQGHPAYPQVRYDVKVMTANLDVQVGGGDGATGSYSGPDLAALCDGTAYPEFAPSEVVVESKHSHLFVNMQVNIAESRRIFGYARSKIQVRLRAEADGGSAYSARDTLYVSLDKIWGAEGIRSPAHEYGHALHHKALGGIIDFSACPSPHKLNGPHNLKCAFQEGFANFHAAITRGSLASEFEQNAYYPGVREYTSDANESDGSTIEGAVAAFYWDLTDPANEGHDRLQFPARYIADQIRTCQVYDGSWRRANGIDHLVYCMEGTVDPAVTGHEYYFATRSPDPSAQQHGAGTPAGWSQTDVRDLWVENLHRLPPSGGPGVPPNECDPTRPLLQPC